MTPAADPIAASDTVSITLPRKVAATIVHHSPAVVDWLHHLLERNTVIGQTVALFHPLRQLCSDHV